MYKEMIKFAPRYMVRMGGFCAIFCGIELAMQWRRKQDDLYNYATAGVITGGLFRVRGIIMIVAFMDIYSFVLAGPAATLTGSVLGLGLALLLGSVQMVGERLTRQLESPEEPVAVQLQAQQYDNNLDRAIATLENHRKTLFESKAEVN